MKLSTFLFLVAAWFLATTMMLSLVTVVPDAEASRAMTMLVALSIAGLTGFAAFTLRFRLWPVRAGRDRQLPFWFVAPIAAMAIFVLMMSVG